MDTAPSIALQGALRFDNGPGFGNLSLTVRPGTWTCVLGPSGIGKSTLLRLIAGLAIGGRFEGSVTAGDGAPLAGRVAYLAQSDLLLPWLDVRENVLIGARLRGEAPDRARAEALIERVGLAEAAAKKPRALSGGMRQRVALARLLMEDRPIALLDEPFAALDVRTRADMQVLAFESLRDRTVLLVTHDPHEAARLGSHLYALTESGLAQLDPPEGDPVRAVDASSVLAAQASYTRALMRAGASV
ncbi:MAG: ABC transporter ATP-binding protein [Pseudomonadota bacterium]